MASMLWLLVSLVALTWAQQPATRATTSSMQEMPPWQVRSVMELQLTAPGAGSLAVTFDVVPLTTSLGLNQSEVRRGAVRIGGSMFSATPETYASISGADSIAYLCCDHNNSTAVDQNAMLATLMENRPKAILLYSQEGSCCSFEGTPGPGSYQTVFTMVNAQEAQEALNTTNIADGQAKATITGSITTSETDNRGGSNSAVAMSVLYSITGLITLLFLIIIGTGAVRAHRYPERYGPRSANGGQPSQSRAKGLARAVLETIPIVKFGSPQPAKPDPNVELESAPGSREGIDVQQAHHLSTIPEDAEAQPKPRKMPPRMTGLPPLQSIEERSRAEEGTAPIGDEHLGCSICTEDFNVGEDVRVLPCDHKFHPTCVDPWLINVSGTCPLCRLDLRPEGDKADDTQDSNNLPPPLDGDGDQDASDSWASRPRRRSSRLFDLKKLRHASVEERIEVLRRYRTMSQQPTAESSTAAQGSSNHEDEHASAKLTDRLRDKFKIKTRAQSPPRRQSPGADDREG